MKLSESIQLISPFLPRILALSLSFSFLFIYLTKPVSSVPSSESMTLLVELDPKENQSTLKSIKQDIESFVTENKLKVKHFGRQEAIAILKEEITEEILPDYFA